MVRAFFAWRAVRAVGADGGGVSAFAGRTRVALRLGGSAKG